MTTQANNAALNAAQSNSTGVLQAAGGGTGNTTAAAVSVLTTNYSVAESGGKLYFYYQATPIASMDSTGNYTSLADITAFAAP